MPGLVIFDCDGVLVDSEPVSNRVLAEAIREAGVEIGAAEVAREFEGMRLADIAAEVGERRGAALPEGWIAEFEERRADEFRRGLEPIPGVDEALERICAAGIPVCVASQASREKTELTLGLTGLARHFEPEALFSSRMVPRGKPHPDLFLLAASEMGHEPERCVVVEDGVPGVRAAVAAGMRALGYAPGSRVDAEDLAGDRAALLASEGAEPVAGMHDLPALLTT